MRVFKRIVAPGSDIFECAKAYHRHEKGCEFCKAARFRHHPDVRLIQGDGVNPDMIRIVLAHIEMHGWSADNVAFGMGGALLQNVNRDTCQFAFKASNIVVDGISRPVHKNPVTMSSKKSKPGRLTLVKCPIGLVTLDADLFKQSPPKNCADMMRTVFLDGELINPTTLREVRERAQ